jgi:8-oxo-dGDP phosphatase
VSSDHFDDDPGPWKVLTREYLSRELWYTVRVDRVELPSGTIIPKYWINEYPPWVSVVAVTADDRVVLIRQYRHGIGAVHFEIPAGTTDPEDTSLEAGARRELLEETGYTGGTWSLLSTLSANPALQNNLSYTFLAEGVTAGTASPDASEDIRVHLVPIAELERLVEGDGFLQALHVAPLLKFLLQRRRAGAGSLGDK